MTVIGWDAFPNQKLVDDGLLTYVDKDELLEKADLISLHAPLIMGPKGTYHMIDAEAIGKMKDTAILINTARGGLIDEEALYDALVSGKIAGAGLDVFEQEPPSPDSPLLKLDQLTAGMHVGGSTREALERTGNAAVDSVFAELGITEQSH